MRQPQPRPRPRPQWDASEMTNFLKCLSHPRRIQILSHLLKHGGSATFKDIGETFKLPAATLSHYIDLYVKAGLAIRNRKADKSVTVSLRLDKAEHLAQWFGGVYTAARRLQGK